jgi:16S rRNA (guanine966-N2)-methyltransferase
MRIISGKYRGRKLNPPGHLALRPTTDMAREALFNILNNYYNFDEVRVLDLFCGTGAISFEFVSRGSEDVTAVDINARCLDFIRKTAGQFGINGLITLKADAFKFLDLAQGSWDIIFADPPYDMKESSYIPDLVFNNKLLGDHGRLIIEHAPEISFGKHPCFTERRSYGRVQFSIFAQKAAAEDPVK